MKRFIRLAAVGVVGAVFTAGSGGLAWSAISFGDRWGSGQRSLVMLLSVIGFVGVWSLIASRVVRWWDDGPSLSSKPENRFIRDRAALARTLERVYLAAWAAMGLCILALVILLARGQ